MKSKDTSKLIHQNLRATNSYNMYITVNVKIHPSGVL